ncbi:polysaccharide biosynthesis tyrosine autokinase [Mumia zhuanghuii]|uniref:non-specific protein-tyrosine kinase n=2 Tax=Mumia TaxID=1546255 RepID=A0ABW1QJP1_9ACTN|nr:MULTISPECIES: polysaccharide biosynthesis tyrosine autokinase [Mumia]KAA1425339.1 polysaccharide biosynthesis tyrosine autokinase [Mumia zhuanghuii]
MGVRELLQVLRRRWLLITGCVVVALAVAGVLLVRATPEYTSTTRLFVSTPQADGTDAYQGGLFSQQRVASYATLLTGEAVAKRVVDRLDLDESPSEISEKISATVVPETVILEVQARDPDPEQAQAIAAATAEEFTAYVGELETSGSDDGPPIKATVVDSATLPESPTTPDIPRTLGLALLLGLLVGVGAALLRETLDTSVRTSDDLEALTDAPALGAIPYDSTAAKSPLVTQIGLLAPRTEAFRVLRTNLQFVDVDASRKVIVVTSSIPEEGKTTTAINLALTLAIAQHRVVLVEGDLRRPRIADYMGLQHGVGLTSVMIGRRTLTEAVQQTTNTFLDVLTSGPIPPNPAELLQSQAMVESLRELRATYDIVLIDAPPLLPITDAAVLASQCDGAILVVGAKKATRDQVGHSVERLANVGARLLGTVLTMASTRSQEGTWSGYGYGYGHAEPPGTPHPRDGVDPVKHRG